jgi:hypothetical protein
MVEYFDRDNPNPALAEVLRLARCPAFPAYEGHSPALP